MKLTTHLAPFLVGSFSLGALAACSSAPAKGAATDTGGAQYGALENAPTTTPLQAAHDRKAHSLQTAFVIVMENHNWSDIAGSPSAPYINNVLLPMGAHAENYRDAGVHPSEPNYVWMEAGSNLAVLDDDDPAANHRTTKFHLTSLLRNAGIDWKSYQEDIAGTACPLFGEGDYAPKHNPMVFFDDMTDGVTASSPTCIAHIRPYTELAADLSSGHVADYNFISPNLCDDMHNDCGGDPIQNGDAWLSREVPKIMASDAYKRGGVILITWDESEDGEYPIGLIALSPLAKPGYVSHTTLSHSSLLRTMQDIYAVQPYIRDAANATGLGEMFVTYP